MSSWSIGFNQSLLLNSETPKKEKHQSDSQLQMINDSSEGRGKNQRNTVARKMRDSNFKFDVNGSESEGSAFCNKDNLLNCIAYVNQDLEMLGFPSLKFEDGNCSADIYFFINRLHDILGLHHKTVAVKEDLETKNHKLSCETNHHQSTCSRLRQEKSQLDKEVGQEKEKTRQINLKYMQVTGKLKSEREEVKRLLAVMQSRDVQHKHDDKKREREIVSLKERLHQLLADKVPDRKVGMDLRNALSSGEGRRATWKTNNNAKLEEEMYQLVISNYEERHRELMLENEDLRDCLLSLQRPLSGLLKLTTGAGTTTARKAQSLSVSTEDTNAQQTFLPSSTGTNFDEGYIQMPFEMVRKEFEKVFKDTCDQIGVRVKQLTSSGASNIDDSGDVENTSGIKSVAQSDSGKRNVSLDATEIERLKKQISNYKAIIGQQEDLIQQSLHSHSQSVETTFLHETQLLKEKENLSEQKKLFFEEKSAFEKERRAFTDAASHFFKERQAFLEEKAKALNQHNVSVMKEKHSKSKGDSSHHTRLLPATPVSSHAKESNGSGSAKSALKFTVEEDQQADSCFADTRAMKPVSKDAQTVTQLEKTANIPALTVQNAPIINFTPSTPMKEMQTSLLSSMIQLGAAGSSIYQPYTSVQSASYTDDIDEAASLASIRAARMRIRTASQQDGS